MTDSAQHIGVHVS